jgi:hypothetical protein
MVTTVETKAAAVTSMTQLAVLRYSSAFTCCNKSAVKHAISGSQSGVTEHANHAYCDAVSIGKYLTDVEKDRNAFMPVAKQNINP